MLRFMSLHPLLRFVHRQIILILQHLEELIAAQLPVDGDKGGGYEVARLTGRDALVFLAGGGELEHGLPLFIDYCIYLSIHLDAAVVANDR